MSKDRIRRTEQPQELITPTIEQGIRASIMLAEYYGATGQFGQVFEKPEQVEPLSEEDVVGRMETLATGIAEGSVKSHREIALVIQEFGPSFGPFGPTSVEVGDAAYRLAKAVYVHQGKFTPEAQKESGRS